MKTSILVITLIGLAGVAAFCLNQRTLKHTPTPPTVAESATSVTDAQPTSSPEISPEPPPRAVVQATSITSATSNPTSAAPAPVTLPKPTASLPFQQALETLVSPQAAFDQKQVAWQHLKESGKLDTAITELEQRASANPTSAAYPAALGQAYLQKAGTLTDIREQGILGMKADQTFDAALNLDTANWDARFWKASALSYWPPELNKGKEVIEHCLELVKIQEAQPTQPQFAQVYVLLGDQYQKQGYPDYAKQVWQRGVSLFPNHQQLAEKLNAQAQTQISAAR